MSTDTDESGYLAVLRCETCSKPVLLLNAEQSARVAADPGHFIFRCSECIGSNFDAYADAGD